MSILNKTKLLKKAKTSGISIARAIILIEIGFIVLYPVLYMLSMAFRPVEQMYNPNVSWIPLSLTLENIKQVWEFMDVPKAMWTTFYLDIVCAVVQTAVCCVVGYGFARFEFKGKNIIFALVIFTIIVPPSTTLIASYLQYRSFDFAYIISVFNWLFTGNFEGINLIDTPFIMWMPALFGMGIRSGLFIFMYKQFFMGLPRELEEAAYLDGCGPFSCFRRIIIPNAKGEIITVLIFSIVWYYNDTFYSSTYLDSIRTMSTSLQYLNENLAILSPLGAVMDRYQVVTLVQAACLVVILPLLIFYIIMQRRFTESVTNSGIVG